MFGWLIACAVMMGLGAITAVSSIGSAMAKDTFKQNSGVVGLTIGVILLLVGFFGGVVVILAHFA